MHKHIEEVDAADYKVRPVKTAALIGGCAAICSVTSFLPQAWRIIKTRDTEAISAPMYTLTVVGFAFWISYGLILKQWPIILANGICLVSSAFILTMKLVHPRLRRKIADGITPHVEDDRSSGRAP